VLAAGSRHWRRWRFSGCRGTAIAWALTRLMTICFMRAPSRTSAFVVVTIVLASTSILACYIPRARDEGRSHRGLALRVVTAVLEAS